MSFKIEYALQNRDLRGLERIFQTDGNLQVLRMNSSWAALLEQSARIQEAVGSIGIEGTVISLKQARAITTGDTKEPVGEKERREFIGYFDSLTYIKERLDEELSLRLLLRIHEKVTQGEKKASPGQVRTEQNAIESKGKIIYTPPPPTHVSFLLDEFFKWFNATAENKEESPIISAAICHFWFVWIHPFMDGNGRVARLLTTFLLMKKKCEGVRYFALSDYYNTHKDAYYDVLEKTNVCDPKKPSMNFVGDLSMWTSFFINSYMQQMQSIREVTNRILQLNIRVDDLRKRGLVSPSADKVLQFLSSREKASYEELKHHLGVSKQRVHQILEPLRAARILVEEKIGVTKWFSLGSPDEEPNEKVFKQKLKSKSVDNSAKKAEKVSKKEPVRILNTLF